LNVNGVLDCIKSAAASPTPAIVVNACTAIASLDSEGQLACIAAVTNTPRP
jgi:hypothetical protein